LQICNWNPEVYAAAASGETGVLTDALNAVDYSQDDIVSFFGIDLEFFVNRLELRARFWSLPQDMDSMILRAFS